MIPVWLQVLACVLFAIGAIGVADVLLFHGRIGVIFADKIRGIFH